MGAVMIKSSTGEVCTPNDDIKALDLHGTNALRARLLQIQADTGSGEEALYAEADIAVGVEQAAQAEIDKAQQAAEKALSDFRSYLAQSTGQAHQALPKDSELVYNYNPDTQKCEITRLDGASILLDISQSNLAGELPLPPQLMVAELNCSSNQLTTLYEVLPASLTKLNCANNRLTTLPEVLPASLTKLYCFGNQLTTLPEVLPASLTGLRCDGNQLTTLPEVLPASMTWLNCYENQLTSLPEVLPASLTRLWCSFNQLTSLPEVLPASLTVLNCRSNQLTKLPEVLPTSLTELSCSGNPDLANNPAAQAALQELRDRGATVYS